MPCERCGAATEFRFCGRCRGLTNAHGRGLAQFEADLFDEATCRVGPTCQRCQGRLKRVADDQGPFLQCVACGAAATRLS